VTGALTKSGSNVVTVGDTGTVTSSMIADGTIADADINAGAAIAYSKLATLTSANILVGNSSNVATSVAVTGDVTISNTGVTAISSGVVVNADVNASAAIAGTKISPDFGSQTVQTTGIFSHALGTASAPTVTFTGDTNTGIYSPGADQVAISTNGTGRLFVDASGNVGVGVTPTQEVDVFANKNGLTTNWTRNPNTGASAGSRLLVGSHLGDVSLVAYSAANTAFGGSAAVLNSSSAFTGGLHLSAGGAAPLVFWTNSSERMRLDSTGRLGLGSSSPGAKLEIVGTTTQPTYKPIIHVDAASENPYTALYRYIGSANTWRGVRNRVDGSSGTYVIETSDATAIGSHSWTQRLAIDANGNVNIDNGTLYVDAVNNRLGIGTTAPNEALEVSGVIRRTNSGSASYYFRGYRNSTTSAFYIYDDGTDIQLANEQSGALQFRTANAERARIDSSGRLLVGTSSSRSWSGISSQFQIENTGSGSYTSQSIIANTNDTVGGLLVLGKSRGTSLGSNTAVQDNDLLGRIYFYGADGSQLVQGATIEGWVDGTPGANDMPGRIVLSTTSDGAATPTERMRITSGGFVLIGTDTTDGNGLSIKPGASAGSTTQLNFDRVGSSTVGYPIVFQNNCSDVGFISHNNTSTAYSTSSDYRLKENVVEVTDGITRLLQLKPSRFNFIADPDKTVDGFLAHEAQAVVPECVTGTKDEVDADGNPVYQGIDQSKLVPLLTAALQEAIQKIEDLEGRLTAAGL
jgi:hypothetical protein